jgi:hypothetical protein
MSSLNPEALTWYMQEISMHALGEDVAYRELLATLDAIETRQTRLVWFQLTSMLHHAAMISKFLRPILKPAAARGEALRHALHVAENSEVLPRDARDNVEHFDERLDGWAKDASQTILEIVLSDREGYDYLRVAEKRVKRLLIVDELIFVSERKDNTKFELQLRPMHEEVQRIGHAADAWTHTKSPYHFIFPQ